MRRSKTTSIAQGPSDADADRSMVPVGSPRNEPPDAKPVRNAITAFIAQVLGQHGHKLGIRGGPETLKKARSTYLKTNWSGPSDRRPRPGRITKTEI
jgi:hypothetical protein